MRLVSLSLLLLTFGCRTGEIAVDPSPGGDDGGGDVGGDDGGDDGGDVGDDGSDGGDDTGGSTGEDPGPDCSVLPDVEDDSERYNGFTGAEDFAFDDEGYAVSVDENGNLIAEDIEGDGTVVLPGLGYTAGTRYLPDGSLVVARVDRGTLVRVTEEGSKEPFLTGLSYPNGVETDLDGFVYVAEHDAGRVRRVDPDTGEYEIIAEGLTNPNGLRFSTDWQTLFVNSFGGGTVHAITRDGDEWTTELFGSLPGIDREYPLPCDDKDSGDTCTMIGGGFGTCAADDEGELACSWDPDTTTCAESELGDACTSTTVEGTTVESACAEDIGGGDLVCPVIEADRVSACEGRPEWGSCTIESGKGYCVNTWEDVRVCITQAEYNGAYQGTCTNSSPEGELCTSDYPAGPWEGTCIDYGGANYCQPYGTNWSQEGGLDGINVDECDNVYVTEYITGKIWRFPAEGSPDGEEAEAIFELSSEWIPNLRWGTGIGGWKADRLYVMDRMAGRMFELDVGLSGGEVAYPPAVEEE